MKTQTKRTASVAASVIAVGAIVAGAFAFANAAAQPEAEPTPTRTAVVSDYVDYDRAELDAEQDAITDTAEAIEAARIEAERVAAEAAAAEAARIAAEQEAAARQAEQEAAEQGGSGGGTVSAPAPPSQPQAPALVQCPGGSSPTEVDAAGNHLACMPNVAPNGGSCFEGDNGMLPECQPFRP